MPRAKAAAPAATMGAKKPRAPKGGHKLAERFPEGEIMTDLFKRRWRLGKPIGSGGFGLIYLADEDSGQPVKDNAPYVMKVEPHTNGPLFCELHYYKRVAKPELIDQWTARHKVKKLGIPRYISSGSYERNNVKYRYMVMERFGTDLQKLFEQKHKLFSIKTVYTLAVRMLDCLQYIHENGYVHADIKASNILLGLGNKSDHVFLVDYGLAYRYFVDRHVAYKEDPRNCHNGTIEFTSTDAHKGLNPSRRGDLEILGFCLLQWLCSKLPWENKLEDKEYVRSKKIEYMADIPGLLKKCFPNGSIPEEIKKYLQYSRDLGYDEKPDYDTCRCMFLNGLKKRGYTYDGKLALDESAEPAAMGKRKRMDSSGDASDVSDISPAKVKKTSNLNARQTASSTPKARKRAPSTPQSQKKTPTRRQPQKKATTPQARKQSSTTPQSRKHTPTTPRVQKRTPLSPPSKQTPVSPRARKQTPVSPRARKPTSGTPRAQRQAAASAAVRIADTANGEDDDSYTAMTKPRPQKRSQNVAKKALSTAKMRKLKNMVETATQTSPGLQGLRRSKKKTAAK